MTPSCRQPVIVDIIIPKGRSFLNRKRHWRKSPLCSADKPDYKFLVFHPELILSVEFFHIVYDTPNPQTMSGTLCDRNSIREYRHYLHRIFHHEQQMRCAPARCSFLRAVRISSALRQLLYRMHGIFQYIRQDRTEHHFRTGELLSDRDLCIPGNFLLLKAGIISR